MDLNRHEVARLLNISETTLDRWVREESIPAYQMGGELRFDRREIEDWVINRQGDKNIPMPSEVVSIGGTLQYSLYRAIHRGGVLYDVPGKTKEEVISRAVMGIAERLDLDAEVLTDLLLDRERLQPTSLNHGIGIPHTRDFLIPSPHDVVTVVFPSQLLEYGAMDGQPVHTLFLLLACDDKRHLHLLAKIAHFSSDAQMRDLLTQRPARNDFFDVIKSWEGQLQLAHV